MHRKKSSWISAWINLNDLILIVCTINHPPILDWNYQKLLLFPRELFHVFCSFVAVMNWLAKSYALRVVVTRNEKQKQKTPSENVQSIVNLWRRTFSRFRIIFSVLSFHLSEIVVTERMISLWAFLIKTQALWYIKRNENRPDTFQTLKDGKESEWSEHFFCMLDSALSEGPN